MLAPARLDRRAYRGTIVRSLYKSLSVHYKVSKRSQRPTTHPSDGRGVVLPAARKAQLLLWPAATKAAVQLVVPENFCVVCPATRLIQCILPHLEFTRSY